MSLDLVIGVYDGYSSLDTPKGGLRLFMTSLRRVNPTCKVVVLCQPKNLTEELLAFCNLYQAEVYSDFFLPVNFVMMQYRSYLYKCYIEQFKITCTIGKILLADMNDVYFQEDPFQIPFETNFYVACEQSRLDDLEHPSSMQNRAWLEESYSGSMELCNGVYVACAGTILGQADAMIRYLEWYVETQREYMFKCMDQGIWNHYLLVEVPHEKKTCLPYQDSAILTLDHVKWSSLKVEGGVIYNQRGVPYAILHQIDRVPEVLALVRSKTEGNYAAV